MVFQVRKGGWILSHHYIYTCHSIKKIGASGIKANIFIQDIIYLHSLVRKLSHLAILHICQKQHSSRNCLETPDNILSPSKMLIKAAFIGEDQKICGNFKKNGMIVLEICMV